MYYTLVGDAAAYKEADAPWDDEVVQAGLEKVKELNEKYGAHIFNFVYRKRAWSEGEQTWLGHERKRGAILHFNDLVLGQTSEEEKEKRFRCETISQWLKGVESGEWRVESGEWVPPMKPWVRITLQEFLILNSKFLISCSVAFQSMRPSRKWSSVLIISRASCHKVFIPRWLRYSAMMVVEMSSPKETTWS